MAFLLEVHRSPHPQGAPNDDADGDRSASIIPETPTKDDPMAAPPSPALASAHVALGVTQRATGSLPAPGPTAANAYNDILSVDCVVGRGKGSVAEATSLAQATDRADGPYSAVNGCGAKGGGAHTGIGLLSMYGDKMANHPAAAAVKAAISAGVALTSALVHAHSHGRRAYPHALPCTHLQKLLGRVFALRAPEWGLGMMVIIFSDVRNESSVMSGTNLAVLLHRSIVYKPYHRIGRLGVIRPQS